jgi:ParB family chromosome partitioning protein
MAHVKEVIEIPLEDLVVGKSQARTKDTSRDIEELMQSIKKFGLLEPIVVCPGEKAGQYEILTGQRRVLACQKLGMPKILAGVIDEKVDETTAKVISVTENLIRRDLDSKDLIDACTALYKKYGSIKAVCEETALPQSKVREYVKYDRLKPELKKMVDTGTIAIRTALRAQDAAETTGDFKPDEAVKLAKEMSSMSGVQQKKIIEKREEKPEAPIDDVIEEAKTGEKVTQIVVTLLAPQHRALQRFAQDASSNQDDAAAELITESLKNKGYLGE